MLGKTLSPRTLPHCEGYKKFRIGELFNIKTGRDIIIGQTKDGDIPLISHQHENNGISKYIAQLSDRTLFDYKTTIPLADRGVFLATTQNQNFHIGTRVKALTFKDGEQTECTRLFFVTAINKLQTLFIDYLTNATDSLPDLEITLPITTSGDIDFQYMQDTIHELEQQRIHELETYLIAAGFTDCNLTTNEQAALNNLPTQHFKPFKICELFEASNGDKDIQKTHLNGKGVPVVSSGTTNNGIVGKTDFSARVFPANTITIDMFGNVFYQSQPYKMVTHARVFSLKPTNNLHLNENTGLYLLAQLQYLRNMFAYNNMCSWEKIKDLTIALPTTPDNSIDYDFITDYINAIKKSTIQNLKDFIQQEHQAYLKAIN